MISISDLPGELESDILSRVPAKSLARLKSTCKRWYALFKDPRFVKKNLVKAAASEVMLLSNFSVNSISGDLHGIQNSVDPSIEFTSELKDSKDLGIREMIHCNGLMLCVRSRYSEIVVWNPCTGQTRWIKPKTRFNTDSTYGFGYGNSKSSASPCYKILRLSSSYKGRRRLVNEIYEFSTDSWRVLHGITRNWTIHSNGVTLKGNSYWYASDEEDRLVCFILMFDFTTESFQRLSFPPVESGAMKESVTLSVIRDEKLVLLRQNVDYYMDNTYAFHMKIWVADTTYKIYDEGKDLSWTNVLGVDFSHFLLSSVSSFLFDEENKVVVCCFTDINDDDSTRIYIVGKNLRKQVYQKEKTKFNNCPVLISYVPNLVHIHIDNTPPKRPKRKRVPAVRT